jgi:AcrR family transcriptional regulator
VTAPKIAPRRGRPPRHNRQEILAAAAEVLIYRGYSATRYADVAQASGVPVASLQYYFPTLDELLREAMRFGVRAELDRLRTNVAGRVDPWARIREMIRSTISLDAERRRGGWVLWVEYWRAATLDEELAVDCREVDALWVDLMANAIAEGVSAGTFRLHGTPLEAAWELHALLDGLGIKLARRHTAEQAMDAVAMAETAARRLLMS